MTASEHIVEVSEKDFEYEVVFYSQQIPVVVDFWAEWCAPCRVLGPLLERLTREAQGEFRLAKVNVDENPALARRYNVRSIPVIKGFRDGRVIAEMVGAQPEPRLREFIKEIAPGKEDLAVEKGQHLLFLHKWADAETVFAGVLESTPNHPVARLGLLKSLLLQGRGEDSKKLINDFPPSREYSKAQVIQPLAEAMMRFQRGHLYSDDPLEAAYLNSLRLVSRGNLLGAMDGLLEVLRQDKRYRVDEARRIMLALLELLAEDDPLTRQYRNELASALF